MIHVLMHCTGSGDIAGFWVAADDYAYRDGFEAMQADGEAEVGAFEDTDWEDIVLALADTWTASHGWASMELDDMTAQEVLDIFFPPEAPLPKKAARKKSK